MLTEPGVPNPLDLLGEGYDALVNGLDNVLNRIGSFFDPRNNYDPTLGQSQYDFKSHVFPENLTSDSQGHYMIININVPVSGGTTGNPSLRTNINSGINQTLLGDEYSKVDVLRFSNSINNNGGTANESGAFVPQFPRSTRRIAESIALHMPNPVVYNTQHNYEEISMTAIAGTIGTAAAPIVGAAIGTMVSGGLGAIAGADLASTVASGVAGAPIGTISRMAGYPINPRVEVLYATTPQRQFAFEVLMAPRTPKESHAIKQIVKTLRYHSAPELSSIGGMVPTFIPPAEFDITFFNKGVENMNIPRINTCFLERIEVDYAPTGTYATFTNGHPVAVRLSMGFREIEILHKLRVAQGF